MEKIRQIIDQSLATGEMTQNQHDEIMKIIHADGEIDNAESEQLSRIFSAVQNGKLTIVDSARVVLEKERNAKRQQEAAMNSRLLRDKQDEARTIEILINNAIAKGSIEQKEHDRLLKLVHADGEIDEVEKQHLATLFRAIHSGKVKLLDAPLEERTRSASKALAEAKRNAIERDEIRKEIHNKENVPADSDLVIDEEVELQLPKPSIDKVMPRAIQTTTPPIGTAETTSDQDVYSLERFYDNAKTRRSNGRALELLNDRMLDVNLNGRLWHKSGTMVGYSGIVKFTREGYLEHGVSKLIKKSVTGEGAMLTKATGQGNVYLADQQKKISIVDLRGHSLIVNGTSLLAFEETVEWDITLLKQFAAIWKGGLFNVRLSGDGMAAITSHGDPVVLRVTPHEPIMTDVNATVAWSGSLAPQFKTDIGMRTLIGRASGETVQMRFEGDGFVIIQPYEEIPIPEAAE